MPQVLLDLSEETYQRLKERAQATHRSIQELLTRQIIQGFALSIKTSNQAKQIAEEWLHEGERFEWVIQVELLRD